MTYLYYHGGSANHGCEAIVRSTNKLLQLPLTLVTTNIKTDYTYKLDDILTLKEDRMVPPQKPSLMWFCSAVHHKLRHNDYLHTKYAHQEFFSSVNRGDICLSIGGDNYCYAGQDILGYYNYALHKRGAKTILWGCSFEPKDMSPSIAKDIAMYDLIVARETISYETLKAVNPNTILAPDPAFFLDRVDLPLPTNFIQDNTVGINVSPLIMKCESGAGITVQNYENLIEHILDHTDMNIALIPHVVEPGNDDREPLRKLYEKYVTSNRIVLIDDYNAMELKGYIARCRMFIGARTHATIAAYSSCVPTLVVGYSVKAKGIAQDLFGSDENYVLPVQSLTKSSDLTNAFRWMHEHETEIRMHLKQFIPEYCERMKNAVDKVQGMVHE